MWRRPPTSSHARRLAGWGRSSNSDESGLFRASGSLVYNSPPMMPSAIRLVRPGHSDCVVALLTEREYQIGRAETVELTFRDETVSRVHGFLHFDAIQGAWLYRDAGSTFGSALADAGASFGEPIP